jgi:hypothetical protein
MVSALQDISKVFTTKLPETKIKYTTKMAAYVLGVPWNQPYRTLKGIEHIRGKMKKGEEIDVRDLQTLIWSKYMLGIAEGDTLKVSLNGFSPVQPITTLKGGIK